MPACTSLHKLLHGRGGGLKYLQRPIHFLKLKESSYDTNTGLTFINSIKIVNSIYGRYVDVTLVQAVEVVQPCLV